MLKNGMRMSRRFTRAGVASAVVLAAVLGVATQATATVLLRESFGLNGGTRYDAGGNPVQVFPSLELNGLRAEFPNTAEEVWTGPSGHHVQAWQFSFSSLDPYEPFSPYEPNGNGTVTVCLDCGSPQGVDALLAFTPPAEPHRVSADVLPGGYNTTGTAIGFTSNMATLRDNFATFGQAWLILFGDSTGNPRRWELHTNGLAGPSVRAQWLSPRAGSGWD